MDKEVQKELLEYLRQAVEFGKEQGPLVAQELLSAGFIKHLMLLCFFVVILALSASYLRQAIASVKEKDELGMSSIESVLFMVVIMVGLSLGTVGSLMNAYWLYLVEYAPRAYLLLVLHNM